MHWALLSLPLLMLLATGTRSSFVIEKHKLDKLAFITRTSYGKYTEYLENMCFIQQEEDIADVKVHSLENGYFQWERLNFNKKLLHKLFPETSSGNYRSIFHSPVLKALDQVISAQDPPHNCSRDHESNEGQSLSVAEASQFQDVVINTVFFQDGRLKRSRRDLSQMGAALLSSMYHHLRP